MSENTKNTIVTSLSGLAIVRKALAFLNLGDAGKLESFYNKVIKTLKTEKSVIEQNLKTLKFNHEVNLDQLKDQLEDAKDAFEQAKISVNIDKISSHAEQNAHVESFLENLDDKFLAVSSIETLIEEAKKSYEEESAALNAELTSLDKRIAFFSEK